MKKLLKKLLTVLLTGITAVSAATTTSCRKKADITVGILQVNTHDALDKAKNGFIDTLKDWAKSKGKTIAFDVKNAVVLGRSGGKSQRYGYERYEPGRSADRIASQDRSRL